MSIIKHIEKLMKIRRDKGLPIDHLFNPGLPEKKIRSLIEDYQFFFPEDFIELYAWRNGLNHYDFGLFPKPWPTLEESIESYEGMIEYFWPEIEDLEEGVDLNRCFPFAGHDTWLFFFTHPGQSIVENEALPIIATGIGVFEPQYDSIDTMFATVEEYYHLGHHDEEGLHITNIGKERIERIWQQHNPLSWQARKKREF